MARKKKRWRDMDDPDDIFGGDNRHDSDLDHVDPAYDAFRRHIEEQVQGETRAFHELRSTAEHELQAASVTSSPPRKLPSAKSQSLPVPPSVTGGHSLPAPIPVATMQTLPATRGVGTGTIFLLSVIFGAIGFLLHSVLQQTQPFARFKGIAPKSKMLSDANCAPEKVSMKKASNALAKTAKLPINIPESAPLMAMNTEPEPALAPVAVPAAAVISTNSLEVTANSDPSIKGITVRPIELRKGPGSHFEIVDSLPPGFALEGTLTTDRQWLRVKPGSFVSVEAVQFQESGTSQSFQAYWVGPHVANIREFPLTTARVLRKLDPASEIKLQIFNQEWAQVLGGGFVFRKLVTDQNPQALQLPATMRVTVEKAEIRGGPGQQYPVLGIYFKNHKVEVQEAQGAWLRIGPDEFVKAQEMEVSINQNAGKTM